jgi:acyl-coenzyme A synthetase/AMP-(fatty) acid ligase
VDEILSEHPAVAQCLTFGLPHPKLGEEVAAAIVLRGGFSAKDTELRDFAGERLAPFKVPRKFVFLKEIPKGATGKLQRIGLAEKLGLTA